MGLVRLLVRLLDCHRWKSGERLASKSSLGGGGSELAVWWVVRWFSFLSTPLEETVLWTALSPQSVSGLMLSSTQDKGQLAVKIKTTVGRGVWERISMKNSGDSSLIWERAGGGDMNEEIGSRY